MSSKEPIRTLRAGIVGCGKIADGHAEEIGTIPGARLAAACDIEPLMAGQFAERHGIPNAYSDFDRMLAAEQLDVVHITTPPQSHLQLTRKAVAAGAHVVVEKPLAMDAAESRQIVAAVQAAGRKMTINYWPNFDSQAVRFRQMIKEGLLGEVVHIESYYGYNLGSAFGQALLADSNHWVHRLPGQLFHNIIDHALNKIVPLLPEGPTAVHASAFRRFNHPTAPLDELRVMMQAGGVSAYATFCSNAMPLGHFARVYGTKATARVDYALRTVVLDRAQKFPSALGRLFPPLQYGWDYFREGLRNCRDFAGSRFQFFAGMRLLFSMFYQSILQEAPLPIPYSEMLRVAALMDEVFAQVYPKKLTVGGNR
ncbi:MAG: Gfo/Idh/MocA family oxidoreductase [Acidobacteria bacterium]|nr:Gfo/Idh/MocA family oxidoreductase [Acidobacteriota bacterium]